jgi:hypothetical protein
MGNSRSARLNMKRATAAPSGSPFFACASRMPVIRYPLSTKKRSTPTKPTGNTP